MKKLIELLEKYPSFVKRIIYEVILVDFDDLKITDSNEFTVAIGYAINEDIKDFLKSVDFEFVNLGLRLEIGKHKLSLDTNLEIHEILCTIRNYKNDNSINYEKLNYLIRYFHSEIYPNAGLNHFSASS